MNSKILFVCTGNTCRSPMAMAFFNALSENVKADSRGIQVISNSPAEEHAKEAVKKFGANLDTHISRQLLADDIQNYSCIITMTSMQKRMLKSVIDCDKIITLAEFANESCDIDDPYGGDQKIYDMTAQKIYEYIKKGINNKTCRIAHESDSKDIAELEKECFPDYWSESIIIDQITKEQVIVCTQCGKVLGYCIYMNAADEGEILRIAVCKSQRKKGIGKKLLEYAAFVLAKKGVTDIFLEVRRSNSIAISLYESMGFTCSGVRKNYYSDNKEDAIIYNLKMKE